MKKNETYNALGSALFFDAPKPILFGLCEPFNDVLLNSLIVSCHTIDGNLAFILSHILGADVDLNGFTEGTFGWPKVNYPLMNISAGEEIDNQGLDSLDCNCPDAVIDWSISGPVIGAGAIIIVILAVSAGPIAYCIIRAISFDKHQSCCIFKKLALKTEFLRSTGN